jgi:hypothetical protein
MKGIVSIQRIMAARQRLAELSELSGGRPGREIQVRQAVHLLSSVLDELEAVAKDNQQEEEAVVVKFLLRDQVNGPYAVCGIATDITALKQTEELQIRRARRAGLRADIHAAFSGGVESALQTMLQRSTEAIVHHRDAAFVRIWTLNSPENMLQKSIVTQPFSSRCRCKLEAHYGSG